ncbi:hypothetical protein IPM09_03595 [Candidatus Saccharibacteria bacterium]|nr:MAG: hypothetical protein IPM09_03595 [Candidatus Saccharibacteria bacterium]
MNEQHPITPQEYIEPLPATGAELSQQSAVMVGHAGDPATPEALRPLYKEEARRLAAAADRLAALEAPKV